MKKPRLLLHACCAPCLTSVEEKLRDSYDIDIYWYNPNIYPLDEQAKRLAEIRRYGQIIRRHLIASEPDAHESSSWKAAVVDYAHEPEGRQRCRECIYFRLCQTAQYAKKNEYDYFGTTLTVSPRKSAILVNTVGNTLAVSYSQPYLEADFKKQDGYLRSLQISKENNLYRQNYCGCQYSVKKEG